MNGSPVDFGYVRACRALEQDIRAVRDATLRTIDLLKADADRRRERIEVMLNGIERDAGVRLHDLDVEWMRPCDSEAGSA